MSLFKKRLLVEYNPFYNEGKRIYLQTSLCEQVKAPFNANVEKGNNEIVLSAKNIKMVITNIKLEDIKNTVKEGEFIGTSINGKINNKSMCYIGVEILKDGVTQDVLPYLFSRDIDEPEVKKAKEIDKVTSVETPAEKTVSKTISIEPQKKTVKKSSNYKR